MSLVKLSNGMVVNLSHVIRIDKSPDGGLIYLLGMMEPLEISVDDYATVAQIAEYSEAKLVLELSELSPMSLERSMRLFTELMLHFVAYAMAAQQGTLDTFPTQAVYERIANILHQINTANGEESMDEELADEDEEERE